MVLEDVLKAYDYVNRKRGLDPDKRPYIREVVSRIGSEWNKEGKVFLVEAPTGYGKTVISMAIAKYIMENGFKSIITYPLRTLIQQHSQLFKRLFGEEIIGTRFMHNIESPYLVKPITLTTIDTLAMNALGLPPEDYESVLRSYRGSPWGYDGHYLFARSMVDLSDIVMDEVHLIMDSTKSLFFLRAFIEYIVSDLGRNIILMTATLPDILIDNVKLAVPSRIVEYKFKQEENDPFVKDRIRKNIHVHPLCGNGISCVESMLNKTECKRVLMVFNTVAEAVKFFVENKAVLQDKFCGNVLLLHSRFNENDREKKTVKLNDIIYEDCFAIVSTQVIEAGVDISSDLLITELAPANSLIQRIGRLARWNETEGELAIWYDKEKLNGNNYTVYDGDLTKATLEYLTRNLDKIHYHLPNDYESKVGYRSFINYVYSKIPIPHGNEYSDFAEQLKKISSASRNALNLLIKYEGSFVRESSIIGTLPVDNCDSIVNQNLNIKISTKDLIPLSIDSVINLSKKGKLCPATVTVSRDYNRELHVDTSNRSRRFINMISDLSKRRDTGYITGKIIEMGIAGLITTSNYDEDTGLYW